MTRKRIGIAIAVAVLVPLLAWGATKMRNVAITFSTIDSTTIGATTPSTGNFTSIKLNGAGPSGHALVGNGVSYVDTAITAIGAINCTGTYPTDSCYRVYTDGSKEAFGHVQLTFPSGTLATGSVTFPNTGGNAFTVNPTLQLTSNDNADGSNNFSVWGNTLTTSGSNITARCAVNIGGSGCSGSLASTITISWSAKGL